MGLNYKDIGLKVGLEIHFQLDTGRKLFCNCPPILVEDGKGLHIIRRLRPTQSELGQIDPAAYFEFKKGLIIEYIAPPESTCLVELDEEPPHEMDIESLKAALRIAKFINAEIVDEVHVMRKIVVDGSNTTGFQRTSIISLGGSIYIPALGREIGIQTICLEEEAARIVERVDRKVVYNLDRLGIPLIEIATAPEIYTPEEAAEVAKYIGRLVTMTGVRRRGLGTIRQDINISVAGGPVVEIKGVQKLQQLKAVVEFEAMRQVGLRNIAKELNDRGVDESIIRSIGLIDVTEIFETTSNRVIKSGMAKGLKVYAIKLPMFSGLLGREIAPGHRLGKELAERVRFWTSLGGLFHTDEMPKYGITETEVGKLKSVVGASDDDAVVFFVSDEWEAKIAFERIIERVLEAIKGPPKETRGAREDGSTFYMRPRPGMARMYPETDIPPILIDESFRKYLEENPLTPPEAIIEKLIGKYGLTGEMAEKLIDMGLEGMFENLINIAPSLKPNYVASFLTDRLPSIMDELSIDDVSPLTKIIEKSFRLVDKGKIYKESLPEVIITSYREGLDVDKVIERLGLSERVDLASVESFLRDQLRSREDLKALPKNILIKRLMAIAMSTFKGSVDPKMVMKVVKNLVDEFGGSDGER